ncbi:MAG TPA: hypothetical protein VN853_14265 [Polyangia bacterium]|jgi:hypothetical protein|nr:hypothetical protein [Polyangia bacterium]
MKMLGWALGSLSFVVIGCGSGGGNTFSCLMGTGTSRLCIETTTSVPGNPNCGGGMQVAACPRTGADGACLQSVSLGGASVSQTIWYYSGSPTATSQEMSDCADNGGRWTSP